MTLNRFSVGFLALLVVACQPQKAPNPDGDADTDIDSDTDTDTDSDGPTDAVRVVESQTIAVDVLWTIDNSCSMGPYQSALTNSFPIFMDHFLGSGVDYHVGVISTDFVHPDHRGQLREIAGERWIDPQTADPVNIFSGMANMGTGGSSIEMGRSTTYGALEVLKDGVNTGFLRDHAALAVIVISDEEDASVDPSKADFIDYLDTLKVSPDMVTFSSIVNPPGCGFCDGGSAGLEYIDVTNAVGGILWEIGEPDWAQVLDQLGVASTELHREFFLEQLPLPATIEVYTEIDGVRVDYVENEDWGYQESTNSILLNQFIAGEFFISYVLADGT